MATPGGLTLILLVEPDAHLARVISAYLEQDGFQVTQFAALPEAANWVRGDGGPPPDLVILDLDNVEIKRDGANLGWLATLPAVLLSSPPLLDPELRRPDAAPMVRKPFTIRELRRQVIAALHSLDQIPD